MPRFGINHEATEAQDFVDARSYVRRDGKLKLFGDDWEQQKRRVWERDKGICQLCKRPVLEWEIADPDHIVKRSKGGSDDAENLRTAHRDCHNERHPEKRLHFTPGLNAARAEAVKDFNLIYPPEKADA